MNQLFAGTVSRILLSYVRPSFIYLIDWCSSILVWGIYCACKLECIYTAANGVTDMGLFKSFMFGIGGALETVQES